MTTTRTSSISTREGTMFKRCKRCNEPIKSIKQMDVMVYDTEGNETGVICRKCAHKKPKGWRKFSIKVMEAGGGGVYYGD